MKTYFAVITLSFGISLAACSGDSGTSRRAPENATSGHDASSRARTSPAGFREIGGRQNALTIEIPNTWKAVDLSSANARKVHHEAGISEKAAEQVISLLKKNNAIYAVDPHTLKTVGFASNLNGYCQLGPSISAAQLKAQLSQIGATGVRTKDTTVDGRPAIEMTYTHQVGSLTTTGLQYQISGPDNRVCVVTMTGKQGVTGPFRTIAGTIHIM